MPDPVRDQSLLPCLVVLNPAAGRGRANKIREGLRRRLESAKVSHDWCETTAPGHASELALRATRNTHSRILLVGGDGTVADLAPALVDRPEAPPLALIPGGTGNDIAKTLGLSGLTLDQQLSIALEGREKSLDAGRVNGLIFINGFGAGLDGAVAARSRQVPFITGIATYLAAFAMTLPGWKPFRYSADLDGEKLEGEATLVTFANGRICGGGFLLTPRADPADGLVDGCIVGAHGRLAILYHLPKAIAGHHVREPGTIYRQVRRIGIEFDRPLAGHIDGNLMPGIRRADIEVLPGAIRAMTAG